MSSDDRNTPRDTSHDDNVPWELRGHIPETEDDKQRKSYRGQIAAVIALLVVGGLILSTVSGLFI